MDIETWLRRQYLNLTTPRNPTQTRALRAYLATLVTRREIATSLILWGLWILLTAREPGAFGFILASNLILLGGFWLHPALYERLRHATRARELAFLLAGALAVVDAITLLLDQSVARETGTPVAAGVALLVAGFACGTFAPNLARITAPPEPEKLVEVVA